MPRKNAAPGSRKFRRKLIPPEPLVLRDRRAPVETLHDPVALDTLFGRIAQDVEAWEQREDRLDALEEVMTK
jgi:hypothetical protein